MSRMPMAGDMAKILIELPDGQTFVTQMRVERFRLRQHMQLDKGLLGKPVAGKITLTMEGEIPGYLISEEGEQDALLEAD